MAVAPGASIGTAPLWTHSFPLDFLNGSQANSVYDPLGLNLSVVPTYPEMTCIHHLHVIYCDIICHLDTIF